MKKAKNIILFSGIVCVSAYTLLQLVGFVYNCITKLQNAGLMYHIYNELYPSLLLLTLIVLPIVLLVLNLKNKPCKVLAIISAITSGLYSGFMIFNVLTPAMPQYLIYSKLNLIETYFMSVSYFIMDGGLLVFGGFVLLSVGSIMSAFKTKAEK